MGNCAITPCSCEGQIENANKVHSLNDGIQLSHRNNTFSLNKRPIQIKSNQKSLLLEGNDDTSNKENIQDDKHELKTTVDQTKTSSKLNLQLSRIKEQDSKDKQIYGNRNIENDQNGSLNLSKINQIKISIKSLNKQVLTQIKFIWLLKQSLRNMEILNMILKNHS